MVYVIESLGRITFKSPDPANPNQLMTSFLIDPAARLTRLTADPDTIISIYGHSDSMVCQLSSNCLFTVGAEDFRYQCGQSDRLWASVTSDTLLLNFGTVDVNHQRLYLTTDTTWLSNWVVQVKDQNFNTLVEVNQGTRLVEFHLDQATVALTRPAPTTEQLYVNQTTDNRGHTNVCLRSGSASDDPTVIIQPNDGRLTLFTRSQVSDGLLSVSDAYAPPMTLNVFGSQLFNAAWGQTYFYRLGGSYPTRTTGRSIVQLLDAVSNSATIDFSAYRQPGQIAQFIAYSAALMRPVNYTEAGNKYFNDFQEFSGVVDNQNPHLVTIRSRELRRGYSRGALRWRLSARGYLNYEIRYNNKFEYGGPTVVSGLLFITVMTT